MVTVNTYAALEEAVLRDEPIIRLEGAAKHYYEKKTGDAVGGGLVGAVPGLLFGGPIGAAIGAAVGASIGTASLGNQQQKDITRFLLRYYRKSSAGVTYIELMHR